MGEEGGGERENSLSFRRATLEERDKFEMAELEKKFVTYGRQQWGIFRNGRKPDGAMPRGGGRPTGHQLLFSEKKQ